MAALRRLFGIPATDAPIVAIIGRGPSQWASVGRWDVDAMTYEPGARLHARVYSERCDVSPDGKYLCYFTLNSGTDWAAGDTYVAVSRLPWVFALAAWREANTYSRGMCFVDRSAGAVPPPEVGDIETLPFGLARQEATSFAVERRRGWSETRSTPTRTTDDVWDQHRGEAIVMMKPNPRTGVVLQVRGGPVASFGYGELTQETCPQYSLHFTDGSSEVLADVQWADWSHDGRLLIATLRGELQIREGAEVIWRCDTSDHSSRRVAPPEARVW
jgi:hypothetical protein